MQNNKVMDVIQPQDKWQRRLALINWQLVGLRTVFAKKIVVKDDPTNNSFWGVRCGMYPKCNNRCWNEDFVTYGVCSDRCDQMASDEVDAYQQEDF